MKGRELHFFRTAGLDDRGLTKTERGFYLQLLEEWMVQMPDIRQTDMPVVIGFIERLIRYYLIVCAQRRRKSGTYEGCMENLLFLLNLLLHHYSFRIDKERVEKLYKMAIDIKALKPICYAEVADYVIRTELLQKLQFFLEYYYGE